MQRQTTTLNRAVTGTSRYIVRKTRAGARVSAALHAAVLASLIAASSTAAPGRIAPSPIFAAADTGSQASEPSSEVTNRASPRHEGSGGAAASSQPHEGPSGAASQPHKGPASAPSTPHGMHAHHRFEDTERYVKMFEDPARAKYQKPREVVRALHLKPGQTVADLGAGSGYFTFLIARAVGKKGKVFAVDIEPGMIAHLDARAKTENAPNVRTVLAEPADPKLPAASVDLAFICDTWHHIDARGDYLQKLKAALKPGGRIAIVDYQKRPLPVGPSLESKLSRDEVIQEFHDAGFGLVKEHGFLPYQYFLVFSEGKGGAGKP